MPRNQGTSRKGKPKKEMRLAGFGKALQRSTTKRYIPKANGSSAHGQGMVATGAQTIGIEEPSDGAKMKSILEMDNLSDFLVQAQLANKDFQSEREQFLDIDNIAHEYFPTGQPVTGAIYDDVSRTHAAGPRNFSFHELSVPRRPAWIPGVTTAEELEAMENESFLEWRRGVARREEEIATLSFHSRGGGVSTASVTPYEKNLHVWRQLWRVLERSAVVLQIVDARNPLFYLSEDLRTYAIDELGKPMLMVVNKSDFLTARQRELWSKYFTERGINHLFFSAVDEQKKIDDAIAIEKKGEILDEYKKVISDDENDSDCEVVSKEVASSVNEDGCASKDAAIEERLSQDNNILGIKYPLTREQLLDALDAFAKNNGCTPDERYDNRIQYGMVGFPNVGKSSVINVLVGSSKNIHGVVRVAVAAQPGKTKHFQTLLLPDRPDMMLCDCPGLVFPSFVSSTADMIAAGVYPIAQMRDHWPVVSLICTRIPREVLNAHYGIQLPQPSEHELRERRWAGRTLPPPTAEELLGTYCIARSLLAPASGVPDYQRASRVVVKDYSVGKLLYCHPPPYSKGDENSSHVDVEYHCETIKTALRNTKNTKKLQNLKQSLEISEMEHALDDDDDDNNNEEGDDDIILGDLESEEKSKRGDRRGKSHKSIKKWGKKGRKLRNKDPFGCHSDPDSVLKSAISNTGVIVNAGKYSGVNYTRANYAGAKAATPFQGCIDRPEKCRQ